MHTEGPIRLLDTLRERSFCIEAGGAGAQRSSRLDLSRIHSGRPIWQPISTKEV